MSLCKVIKFEDIIIQACKSKKNEFLLLSEKGEIIVVNYDHFKEDMENYLYYIADNVRY